jgi:hypothetical protein
MTDEHMVPGERSLPSDEAIAKMLDDAMSRAVEEPTLEEIKQAVRDLREGRVPKRLPQPRAQKPSRAVLKKRKRDARYKARKKRGAICVSIELSESRFESLARLDYFADSETNPRKIAKGVERLIDAIEWPRTRLARE